MHQAASSAAQAPTVSIANNSNRRGLEEQEGAAFFVSMTGRRLLQSVSHQLRDHLVGEDKSAGSHQTRVLQDGSAGWSPAYLRWDTLMGSSKAVAEAILQLPSLSTWLAGDTSSIQ